MLKKNVKFLKQIADRVGAGFELPESVFASVVSNVPKNEEQAGRSSGISSSAFERFGRGRP